MMLSLLGDSVKNELDFIGGDVLVPFPYVHQNTYKDQM